MSEIARLTAYVSADVSNFNKGMGQARDSMGRFTKNAGEGEKSTVSLAGAFGRFNVVALAVGAALKVVADGLRSVIKAASDEAEAIDKVRAVFKESSKEIEAWSTTTAKGMGMARAESLETVGTIGALLKNSGLMEREAAKMSVRLTQLMADQGALFNRDTADAIQRIISGVKGEGDALDELGIKVSEAKIKEEARTMGLIKGKQELDDTTKVQAIFNMMLKQGADGTGFFAKSMNSLTTQQKLAKAEFTDFLAKIGKDFLPIATEAVKAARSIGAAFADLYERIRAAGVVFAKLYNDDILGVKTLVNGVVGGFKWAWDTVVKLSAAGAGLIGKALSWALNKFLDYADGTLGIIGKVPGDIGEAARLGQTTLRATRVIAPIVVERVQEMIESEYKRATAGVDKASFAGLMGPINFKKQTASAEDGEKAAKRAETAENKRLKAFDSQYKQWQKISDAWAKVILKAESAEEKFLSKTLKERIGAITDGLRGTVEIIASGPMGLLNTFEKLRTAQEAWRLEMAKGNATTMEQRVSLEVLGKSFEKLAAAEKAAIQRMANERKIASATGFGSGIVEMGQSLAGQIAGIMAGGSVQSNARTAATTAAAERLKELGYGGDALLLQDPNGQAARLKESLSTALSSAGDAFWDGLAQGRRGIGNFAQAVGEIVKNSFQRFAWEEFIEPKLKGLFESLAGGLNASLSGIVAAASNILNAAMGLAGILSGNGKRRSGGILGAVLGGIAGSLIPGVGWLIGAGIGANMGQAIGGGNLGEIAFAGLGAYGSLQGIGNPSGGTVTRPGFGSGAFAGGQMPGDKKSVQQVNNYFAPISNAGDLKAIQQEQAEKLEAALRMP